MKSDRRTFLKTAAASAAAIGVTAYGSHSQAAAAPAKWDHETDVVVLGAGGGGLMAAIQATLAGAKVMVFEKGKSVFVSSTSMSGGLWSAVNTKAQTKKGLKDDPAIFFKDLNNVGDAMNYPHLVQMTAEHSGEAFDWFCDQGFDAYKLDYISGHTVDRSARTNTYSGRDYVEVLWKIAQEKKIPVEFSSPVSRIYYDSTKNSVSGVEVDAGGRKINVKARNGVIIATGGFSGSPQMFDDWIPAYAGRGVLIGGSENSGDGIRIAVRDAGVPTTHMQTSGSYPGGVELGKRSGPFCRCYYVAPIGAILLNKEGKRYVDETTPAPTISVAMARQPDKVHWMLVDGPIWDDTMAKHKIGEIFAFPSWDMERVEKEIAAGKHLFRADTLEQVAQKAGLPPAEVVKTVAEYNDAQKAGKDPLTGRIKMPKPIVKGPFFMVRMSFWTDKTMGGLRVDKNLNALNAFNQPISGLYAIGDAAGGFHGQNYLSGCGLAWAFTSGWLAGKAVAKAV